MQIETKPIEQVKRTSWVNTMYQRTPWLRVQYAQRVLPPNQQRSNNSLADELVMQRRNDPISFAFPMNTHDVGTGEQSGAKR